MAMRQGQVAAGAAAPAVTGEIRSYIDWAAVIAGTVLSSAISLVLLTFGAAIGLSMVSPFEGEGASGPVFAVALGLWVLWVVVSSFMAGGYLAGRMRRRAWDATPHEVEVRDGAHGLSVWALGILVAGLMAAAGVSGVVRGGAEVGGGLASAGAGKESPEAFDYAVDSLFRSADQRVDPAAARGEVARILARSAVRGGIAAADRTYIARLVAARTGVEPLEAERRIDQVMADAKKAADTARRTGIWTAFLAAAVLLTGAAAAWWAASAGGRHRDEGTDFSRFTRWR
ncbi:hypothetical protein [Shumkonia mesophila]|uniref:hypothetical protein n=1 Tax=Shumkonia mesophila TaxID=2838854 RepID=UPI00293458EF|nr:hypothetical protein [Shumkonia mesophila]